LRLVSLSARESFPAEALPQAPPGVRILIVDDDPRIRRTMANVAARSGFHVLTADDGKPAIATAEQTPPDLVLVDFNMPTPGLEVVRRLKALFGPAVWIAVLSGQDDAGTRALCFDAGADDVIGKPVPIPELRRRMINAARTQQAYVETRLGRERADRLLAYGAEASAMLAHDLNNGLAVALCNMMYLSDVLKLEDDDRQAMTATTDALRRMSGLVANFVDIARFEDAACKPQRVATNVRGLLETMLGVHAAVKSRHLAFEIECAPAVTGNFDPALIERVLHNLVGNAVRYCNKGGVVRLIGVPWDSLEGSGTELVVFNTGPTIPDGQRDKLFAKYAKGTGGKRGFGLYFCRLACEAHGGTIDYVPTDGGSTFRVRIPNRD
jgi:DNA-binding response OmpR family regulator